MDVFDEEILALWKLLHLHKVRYIMVELEKIKALKEKPPHE